MSGRDRLSRHQLGQWHRARGRRFLLPLMSHHALHMYSRLAAVAIMSIPTPKHTTHMCIDAAIHSLEHRIAPAGTS